MNNFGQRALTAIIGGAVFVASIILSQYSFIFVFAVIALMSLWEFYSLIDKTGLKTHKATGIITSILLLAHAYYTVAISNREMLWIFAILVFPIMTVVELYKNHKQPFSNIAYSILGIVYVVLPFVLLIMFAFSDYKYHWQLILGFLIIIWANDSGAYLVGVKFGKHKMFERISPKKTWEGTIGGIVIAGLFASFFSQWLGVLSTAQWLIMAALIVTFAIWGDLVESMFKRSINIKDSGSILPGHGGFLDRFDSVYITAPVVALYLLFVNV